MTNNEILKVRDKFISMIDESNKLEGEILTKEQEIELDKIIMISTDEGDKPQDTPRPGRKSCSGGPGNSPWKGRRC